MRVLLLIDKVALPFLRNGEVPGSPYSHDKNLFQFGHEALRKGYKVFLASVQDDAYARPYYETLSLYPTFKKAEREIGYSDVKPDIVVSVFAEALNIRQAFPHPKIVAINAAVHWVESPERFPGQYVYDLITAARHNIDFMITQNQRMKEILEVFFSLLAKWPYGDRILVSPLGIVSEEAKLFHDRQLIRKEMGLTDNDVAIINSGGVWKWTDFLVFYEAFCEFTESTPNHRLKLFVMGIKQQTNIDHEEYVGKFKELVYRSRDFLGNQIRLTNDWDQASKVVKKFTFGADVGVNVNMESLENWQSYRLRFLDYLHFGIPPINTAGDMVSDQHADACYIVKAGNKASYLAALKSLNENRTLIKEKSERMKLIAKDYDSRNTYGMAIDKIVATPRRDRNDTSAWGECVLDYSSRVSRGEMASKMKERFAKLFVE